MASGSGTFRHVWFDEIEPWNWAYYCRLIGPKECKSKCYQHQQRNRFGAYIAYAENAIHRCCEQREYGWSTLTWQELLIWRERRQEQLHYQAKVYGRFLDLHERFCQLCPWNEALQAWEQARVPELTLAERSRRNERRKVKYWYGKETGGWANPTV